MSTTRRNNNEEFCAFKAKMAKKRMGKEEPMGSASDMDYIRVQWLSSNVEGALSKVCENRSANYGSSQL